MLRDNLTADEILEKEFMEFIWTKETIKGKKVVNRHLGFGSWPDIKLTLEDGSFVSAKKLFNEMLEVPAWMLEEMAEWEEHKRIMENGHKPF